MIDANAVEVGQQTIHTRGEQLKRRAWNSPVARATAVASNEVLVGIEHRVAPRLPVRVGAAGRRAHQVAREKEPTTAPDIAVRVADLQVAERAYFPCPSFCLRRGLAQHRMLPVEDELPEEVLVDLRRAKPPQLRLPLRRPGRQSRRRTMKALIDAAGLQAGPATPARRCHARRSAPRSQHQPEGRPRAGGRSQRTVRSGPRRWFPALPPTWRKRACRAASMPRLAFQA